MFRRKGFVEGSLVESDPAHYALSAAFKWSFGALADRSKPQGSVEEVAFGSFSTELGCPRHVRFTPVSDHRADIAGGWPLHRCRRRRGRIWKRGFSPVSPPIIVHARGTRKAGRQGGPPISQRCG